VRLHAWLTMAGLLLVAAGAAGREPDEDRPTLVDLTDEFDAFWEASRDQTAPARAAAFRTYFETFLPGFYSAARVRVAPVAYDEYIARALAAYPAQREAIREVSGEFSSAFSPALRRFEARLGSVRMERPVYLINSLGEMDGGVR
jgi:hypothetical protein